ncbi:acyltransferase family protein [Microbulbifer yueqingensis]|uniref:Predicted acyltransferase n=1 Tax=Microbulbifer yueqingensis TaxID=658219 RepID=A0A1G9BF28_9GAMM|nr:heparan-alpha-glucosaminide N-acetyltransferase domain-containing protein [Microbulbifer yueqingensis]SDK38128.1 Predicted acyltransferase [Microbulbifer yueqingensis]
MGSITTTPSSSVQVAAPATAKRILALDALRGLAVMGMILVVSPGSWGHRLPMLDHAPWHGYTLADLVFPAFLFAVGAAMALGFPNDRSIGQHAGRVGRRTLSLIGLGLLLNLLPSFDFTSLRIPGVLQRIGVCYVLAATIILALANRSGSTLHMNNKGLVLATGALLIGWILVLTFTSAPGYPAGSVTPAGTLAAWVDRQVFTVAHLWPYGTDAAGKVVYDPEGLLASFPATANVLIGAIFAHWLGRAPSNRQLKLGIAAGFALVCIGHLLDPLFVINKRIWTSSFAIVSSGWAAIAYCVLFFVLYAAAGRKILQPVLILGGNAIFAFILSQVFLAYSGTPIGDTSPQNFGFQVALSVVGNPWAASLLCAFGIVTIVTLLVWPLNRKGIFIRL